MGQLASDALRYSRHYKRLGTKFRPFVHGKQWGILSVDAAWSSVTWGILSVDAAWSSVTWGILSVDAAWPSVIWGILSVDAAWPSVTWAAASFKRFLDAFVATRRKATIGFAMSVRLSPYTWTWEGILMNFHPD